MKKQHHNLTKKELETLYENLFKLRTTTWATDTGTVRACKIVQSALLGPIFAATETEKEKTSAT